MTTLFEVISKVESSGNAQVMRFEPMVYERVSGAAFDATQQAIMKANPGISHATAEMIYATSWGAVQIMGFNLYGMLGYGKPVVDYLASITDQQAAFQMYCEKRNIMYGVDTLCTSPIARTRFGTIYNGNGGLYAPMIVRSLKGLGLTVVEDQA